MTLAITDRSSLGGLTRQTITRPTVKKTTTTPQTVMDWVKEIDSGKADPQRVISECKLGDTTFDYLLTRAYLSTGGFPSGV